MNRTWTVRVDRASCQGVGMCVSVAPGRFELEAYRSKPIAERIDAVDEALEAAELCPMQAISITDSETGEVLALES